MYLERFCAILAIMSTSCFGGCIKPGGDDDDQPATMTIPLGGYEQVFKDREAYCEQSGCCEELNESR